MRVELNVKYRCLYKEHACLLFLQLRKSWLTFVPLSLVLVNCVAVPSNKPFLEDPSHHLIGTVGSPLGGITKEPVPQKPEDGKVGNVLS